MKKHVCVAIECLLIAVMICACAVQDPVEPYMVENSDDLMPLLQSQAELLAKQEEDAELIYVLPMYEMDSEGKTYRPEKSNYGGRYGYIALQKAGETHLIACHPEAIETVTYDCTDHSGNGFDESYGIDAVQEALDHGCEPEFLLNIGYPCWLMSRAQDGTLYACGYSYDSKLEDYELCWLDETEFLQKMISPAPTGAVGLD